LQKYQELEWLACEQATTIPLIVNSDGWVKGLGYEILSAIVAICNPAHIVQILGSTKAKSFDMTPFQAGEDDNAHSHRNIYAIQSFDESANGSFEEGNKFHHRGSLDSSQCISTGPLLATASDHRAHRICAYFLQGCDKMPTLRSGIVGDDTLISFHKEKGIVDPSNIIGLALSSMPPYAVPFKSVRLYPPPSLLDSMSEVRPLWGFRADLAYNDLLDSLAGAIVGLCCEPDPSDIASSIFNCNDGCGVPILPCAGLGIIRSIDYVRRIFYVLTPVHPNLLSGVASFVGGNVSLPLECVYRGIYSDSFPHLTFGQVAVNPGLGSEVMKSRNHSGRKK
jgi:polynucleotide 5'-hydroxyl-kinase GRC3/NOL9